LLDALSLPEAAARVEAAVAADLVERSDEVRPTTEIGDAIAARLA
jgi:3-isopropylmalate dehydrogenase